MTIYVIRKFGDNPYPRAIEVDTTSHGSFKDLSPFYLGPYVWQEPLSSDGMMRAENMENLWQYSKVYSQHLVNGKITMDYLKWRFTGYHNRRAVRYPMGKGAKPLYSLWLGEELDYVAARKKIYAPIYAELVLKTESYRKLYNWVIQGYDIVLRDFDGYDYVKEGKTLVEVINDPTRTMGHAFVIAMLLTGTLEQCLQ